MFDRFRDGRFAVGFTVGGGIAIVSIVWVIGLNYCPYGPCDYRQAADDANGQRTQRVWQVPDPGRVTFSYEYEPEFNGEAPSRHEYYDLRAQERVAHATDWLAWVTFFSSLFGVGGLIVLIATLRQQRFANEITDRTFAAQLRPVFVVEIDRESEKRWRNGQFQRNLMFRVRNVGQGAGIMTRLYRQWDFKLGSHHPVPIDPEAVLYPDQSKECEIAVGPGALSTEIRANETILQKAAARSEFSGKGYRRLIQEDDLRLFFSGFIEYRDLIGKRYRSGFCFIWIKRDEYLGIHLSWPQDGEAVKHNYHREL